MGVGYNLKKLKRELLAHPVVVRQDALKNPLQKKLVRKWNFLRNIKEIKKL
jgi:hypothetical protein